MAITLVSRALILDPPAPGAAPGDVQGITERVSVRDDGAQVFNESGSSSVSADGRFVAFESNGRVVPGRDFNQQSDIYLRDRETGDVRLVSVACEEGDGTLDCNFAGGDSFEPEISATVDGAGGVTAVQVTFESDSEDLVWVDDGDGGFAPLDNNFDTDIFQANFPVTDGVLATQPAMTLVSVFLADPCFGDLPCFQDVQFEGAFDPAVSADGTQVAFEVPDFCTDCMDIPDDTVGGPGVWIRNLDVNGNGAPQEPDPDPDPDPIDPVNDTRSIHVPTLFAADPDLRPGEDGFDPDLSPDGRYLVWVEDRGSTFDLDLIWLYDRNLDGDASFDEPNADPDECTTVCVLPGNRHPDEPFPTTDIDEDGEPEYTDVGVSNSLFFTNTFDPVVAVDAMDPADVTDDEVVVAYSFCADCNSSVDGSILLVPEFMELVVVTTFDPDVVGTRDPADPEDLLDPSTGTVVVSQGLDGPEDYGDGNGSGEPSLSGDGRYLAFVISDGDLAALDEGQLLPVPGVEEECFRFVGPGSGDDSTDIPCEVVLHDRRQPDLGLRFVSVGGDPRDAANPQVSLAGEPTMVGNTTDPDDFNDGDSFLPSVSGDGSVVAFETQADNLLGTDATYYVDAPFDSNRFEDVYVRELTPILSSDTPGEFGLVQIGSTGTATITITNGVFNSDGVLIPGIGPVTIPAGSAVITPGDFTIQPGDDGCADVVLHGGESCTIVVTFTPVSPDDSTGTVTVTYPHPVNGPVQIELRGSGVLPVLTADPPTIDFGDVQIDSDETLVITITNDGTATAGNGPVDLRLADIVISGSSEFFTGPGDCFGGEAPEVLALGESCSIEVTFFPSSPGLFEAELDILFSTNPDDPDPPFTLETVSLSGNSVLPQLTATPAPLSFGGVVVDDGPTTRTLTITNVGLADVTFFPDFGQGSAAGTEDVSINAIDLTGSDDFTIVPGPAGNTCTPPDPTPLDPEPLPVVLEVGEDCFLQFAFDPSTPGLKSANFTLDYRGFQPPLVDADINGIGVLRPPIRPRTIVVDPLNIDFGVNPLGTQSATRTVTVRNTGDLPVSFDDVSLVGAAPGDFVIVDSDCEGSLPVGQSCTVDVAGKPTVPGNRTAALLIEDDATGNPHLVGLTVSANEPILILNPGVVRPGTTTKAIGTNWVPGSIVDLSFAGDKDSLEISPESVVVGADGTFEATILVLPKREAIPRVVTATSGTIVVDENLLVTLGSLTVRIGEEFLYRG